ncbi:MAG: hypothetical protein FJ100_05015 [Deltaproteobacteria bacterium]|nr:hypothetical protein [Deltaproteobacteria bacterium]
MSGNLAAGADVAATADSAQDAQTAATDDLGASGADSGPDAAHVDAEAATPQPPDPASVADLQPPSCSAACPKPSSVCP